EIELHASGRLQISDTLIEFSGLVGALPPPESCRADIHCDDEQARRAITCNADLLHRNDFGQSEFHLDRLLIAVHRGKLDPGRSLVPRLDCAATNGLRGGIKADCDLPFVLARLLSIGRAARQLALKVLAAFGLGAVELLLEPNHPIAHSPERGKL